MFKIVASMLNCSWSSYKDSWVTLFSSLNWHWLFHSFEYWYREVWGYPAFFSPLSLLIFLSGCRLHVNIYWNYETFLGWIWCWSLSHFFSWIWHMYPIYRFKSFIVGKLSWVISLNLCLVTLFWFSLTMTLICLASISILFSLAFLNYIYSDLILHLF